MEFFPHLYSVVYKLLVDWYAWYSVCVLLFVKTRCLNTISAFSTKLQSYICTHYNNMAADTNLYVYKVKEVLSG